jgi:HEAT repeat protein
LSPPVYHLVHSLFEKRSLVDRLRGRDHRIASLDRIAASREVGVIPDLLALLVADESLAPYVARTIAELARDVTPVQLSSLDEDVRRSSFSEWSATWRQLAPGMVSRLAQAFQLDVVVIGLVTSHANGFVRAAALEVLAQRTGGEEIPFLSLRANDWVEPVAARASELLISRLRPDNRHAVLNALPFIVRMLRQDRRDHSGIESALKSALISDSGIDALAHSKEFGTLVRRTMYKLTAGGTDSERAFVNAVLKDPDAVVRARAIQSVAADPSFEDRAATLERLLREDPVPAVRKLALAVFSEHMPERVAEVFPQVLLDRAASVRGLARFIVDARQLPFVPRAIYVDGLAGSFPGQLAAAIQGVGETGIGADAALIAPFLSSGTPRIRRSALRALAKLHAEGAVSAAIAALTDTASSVRSAAVDILTTNARRVDFDIVSRRVRAVSDPRGRSNLLRLFLEAPKWDTPVFLLEALTDPDDDVRASAARLVERWIQVFNRDQTQPTTTQLQRISALLDAVAPRLPEKTAKWLRFSLKPM